MGNKRGMIVVREFVPDKDAKSVEAVERKCEVGPSGKLALFTDLMGDPICRVRHSPAFLMLVAEIIGEGIVGMIRGSIKTVTWGRKCSLPGSVPVYTEVAYILGLRVSPSHRRMGIGWKLVTTLEEWFRHNGAEYSYMATESDNHASIALFTGKCGYSKFRTPCILVNPIFAHRTTISKRVAVIQLSPREAELLYQRHFSATMEFFPRDIDSVLYNPLSLGTFVAVEKESWRGMSEFLSNPPESWAVLSVWDSMKVFKLCVRGISLLKRIFIKATRLVDQALPFMKLPSLPVVFRPFGVLFLYGVGGEGKMGGEMLRALCRHAHNLGTERGYGMVATEVSSCEPLRFGIPHWEMLSCEEDLWCMKKIGKSGAGEETVGDWMKSPPALSMFVDPREF